MKPTDKKVIDALRAMEKSTAVIYRGDNFPLPIAWAGVHDGQLKFFTTDTPQVIRPELKATVSAVGIAFRADDGELRFYITTADEAPERGTGALMDQRQQVLDTIEEAGGVDHLLKIHG